MINKLLGSIWHKFLLRDIEVYHRVSKFEKEKSRPLKVTIQSRQAVDELLKAVYKL